MTRIWFVRFVATAGLILVGTSSMAIADESSTDGYEEHAAGSKGLHMNFAFEHELPG